MNSGISGHYLQLKSLKEPRQNLMNLVNHFFNPDDLIKYNRSGNYVSAQSQVPAYPEILDSTGSDLLMESVTYVFGLFFDQSRKWFSIEHEDFDPEHEVNKIMQERADKLFTLIGTTNYYSEMVQHDWDNYVHGHALLLIQDNPEDFAVCRSKNPINVYFKDNDLGQIIEVYWEEELTSLNLADRFGKDWVRVCEFFNLSEDQSLSVEDSHTLVTCLLPVRYPFFNHEEIAGLSGFKWAMRYYVGTKNIMDKREEYLKETQAVPDMLGFEGFKGFKHKIAFPVRDYPTRQHPYGKGEGKRCLSKARVLNSVMRDVLTTSRLTANPPKRVTANIAREMNLTVNKDGYGYEIQDLIPGSTYIFDGNAIDPGIEPITLLDIAGDVRPLWEIYNNQREQFGEMLPIAGSIYKVARQSIDEIQERSEQQQKRLGPIRANYLREALVPHLNRFYQLAEDKGYFKDLPLPDGVDKKKINFIFDAYRLQIDRMSDSIRLSQTLGSIANFFALDPSMADYLDGDKIIKSSFAANGVFRFLLSDDIVNQIRERTAQQMNQRQQLESADADSKVLKSFSDILSAIDGGAVNE